MTETQATLLDTLFTAIIVRKGEHTCCHTGGESLTDSLIHKSWQLRAGAVLAACRTRANTVPGTLSNNARVHITMARWFALGRHKHTLTLIIVHPTIAPLVRQA